MEKPISITRTPITYQSTGNPRYDRHILIECNLCGEYFLPRSNQTRFCEVCRKVHSKQASRERWIKNGRKQTNLNNFKVIDGKKVYVHSGYNQKGKNNNNYKNGTGIDWYKEAIKILPEVCNRCGNVEKPRKVRNLLLHHKDGNHNNNDTNNWEILCKRCHQEHHSKRGSDGRFVSDKG